MQSKFPIIPLTILIICITIFGYTFNTKSENKLNITWSERDITWEDFEILDEMEGNTVALIYTSIAVPNLITENDSKVYAYMNPNFSSRLKNKHDFDEVLKHEQYHFNIAEYCARLLRKELVQEGLGGLSTAKMKALRIKYDTKLDSLQDVYDNSTDHSTKVDLQRYWELKIDDLLRQTAYYENEDIYSYYDFTKNRTQFYKHIFFTFSNKVLTSYAIAEKDILKGKAYQVEYISPNEKVIKFYKDGELINGGHFETAIVKILTSQKGVTEIQYLNEDGSYNTKRDFYRKRSITDDNKNLVEYFLDESGDRIAKKSIYEIRWQYDSINESYYASFYDKSGEPITNSDGIFHVKRSLDKKQRTIRLDNFDRKHKLKNDKRLIASYKRTFNYFNQKSSFKLFDENGDYAYHLGDYHLKYKYDERGNIVQVASLDKNGRSTYDSNGASIYEYTYDLFDRETSVKRFNAKNKPVVADDDFFQHVKEFNAQGRLEFEAYYYPEYVLKFTDNLKGATTFEYEGDTIIKEYNTDAYGTTFENKENVAIVEKHIGNKKEVLEELYYDSEGNYAKTSDNVVGYRYRYDENTNQIEASAYDSIGKLIPFEADVARIKWEYDARNNKLNTTYYTNDNQLAITNDSVTYNSYKYDNNDNLIERTNFDINKKPALIDGTFKTHFLINKIGLDSEQYEYNIHGKLKTPVAITKYFYNKYNNKVRTEYFNSNRKRVNNSEGISAEEIIYNKRQYVIGYKYYDTKNKLTNKTNGIAFENWQLNERGHTLIYQCFDKNGRPVVGPNGYHKLEYQWDAVGKTSQTAIYDHNTNLIEDSYGTAIYEYELRPSGLYSKIKRYNKENELAENTDGVAVTTYAFSLDGLYYIDEELNAQGEVVNDTITEDLNDSISEILKDSIPDATHNTAAEIVYDSISQILNDSIF